MSRLHAATTGAGTNTASVGKALLGDEQPFKNSAGTQPHKAESCSVHQLGKLTKSSLLPDETYSPFQIYLLKMD